MGLRVLVVEDDVDARDALALLLASHGYDIETAEDAEDAIRKAASFAPDVLICDWRLPGTRDGVDVARALQGETNVTVIFVTAHSVPELRARTADIRVHAFIPKPIDVARLRSALAALN
jgi:DNA-binding response OmpR family regulator